MTVRLAEQIRERLHVSSLVERYVSLKSKGGGEYIGLCPFHQEKTPSFTVSDDKRFYYCFGCGAHGDVISFLMEYTGVSYADAILKLASECVLDATKFHDKDYYQKNKEEKDKISLYYEILSKLAEYYHNTLYNEEGVYALEYLKNKRKLNDNIIKRYNIGYAPKDHKIIENFLHKNCKFDLQDIIHSGAMAKSTFEEECKEEKLYNPFAGRITFPIYNRLNKVIAFGGRILDHNSSNASNNKYLNSSDTQLFNKSKNLYSLNFAKEWLINQRHLLRNNQTNIFKINEINIDNPEFVNHITKYYEQSAKNSNVIVVEGYMDVVTLALAGIGNAVAPLGTAIKIEQIQTLWQFSHAPTILMDNDLAGRNAMERIAKIAIQYIEPNKTLNFLLLNDSSTKDPADFINKYGVGKFCALFNENQIGLADFIFESTFNEYQPYNTPEKKSALYNELMLLTKSIKNTSLQKEYVKHMNNLYNLKFSQNKDFGNAKYNNNYHAQNKQYNNKNKYVQPYDKYWIEKNIAQEKMFMDDSTKNAVEFCVGEMHKDTFTIPIHIVNIIQILCFYPHLLKDSNIRDAFYKLHFKNTAAENLHSIIMKTYDENINNIETVLCNIFDDQLHQLYDQLIRVKTQTMIIINTFAEENNLQSDEKIPTTKEGQCHIILKQCFRKIELESLEEKIKNVEQKLKEEEDIVNKEETYMELLELKKLQNKIKNF